MYMESPNTPTPVHITFPGSQETRTLTFLRHPTHAIGADLEAGASPLLWRLCACRLVGGREVAVRTWQHAAMGGALSLFSMWLTNRMEVCFDGEDLTLVMTLLLALHTGWMLGRVYWMLDGWIRTSSLEELLLTRLSPREIASDLAQGVARPILACLAAAGSIAVANALLQMPEFSLVRRPTLWLVLFPFVLLCLFHVPWIGMAARLEAPSLRTRMTLALVSILLVATVVLGESYWYVGIAMTVVCLVVVSMLGSSAARRVPELLVLAPENRASGTPSSRTSP